MRLAWLALVLFACRPAPAAGPIVVDARPQATPRVLAATIDPHRPCAMTLDAAREPTDDEVLALALPDFDPATRSLPAGPVRLCNGRAVLAKAATPSLEHAPVPPAANVPPSLATLRAYRLRLGEGSLTLLARREGARTSLLATADGRRKILPMALLRVGDRELVVRERRGLPSFRGHARDVLEVLPPGAELDADVRDAGEILVAVTFCDDCQRDGWKPPWVGAVTTSPVRVEGSVLRVDEEWRFVHGKTGEATSYRVERRYRWKDDALREAPTFDETANRREVNDGLAPSGLEPMKPEEPPDTLFRLSLDPP